MQEKLDIRIKNAQLRKRPGEFFEIGISDGRIMAIEVHIDHVEQGINLTDTLHKCWVPLAEQLAATSMEV